MTRIYERGKANLHANLTPMIDVTFLLIVFFVLVSQIVEVENVDLALPELDEPASAMPGKDQRTVINIVPGSGGRAVEYRVGGRGFEVGEAGVEALTEHLVTLLGTNPTLRMNLRADQRTRYEWVHPVLQAISTAATRSPAGVVKPRVNLVVVRED